MANIFAILTALVLAVAGFLAYANMGDETEPGKGYKGWIKKRTDEENSRARNQSTLGGLQEELTSTEAELADYNSQNDGLQTEVDAQLKTNEELQANADARKSESEAKAQEVADKEDVIKDIGDAPAVIATLKSTKSKLAELSGQIGELTAQRAALEGEKRSTETVIEGLKGEVNQRVSGKSSPDLRTTVRSVYPGLGFVTLAAGDSRGVVKDSFLDVVRDGEVIGKLQVSTVEANTAAADIVPGSVPDGSSIVAGDLVVPEQKAAN